MSLFSPYHLVAAAYALAAPLVFAQSGNARTPADDRMDTPSTLSLEYQSSFSNYRAFTEQPIVSWREANDTVKQVGGWRAYAKESLQPEPPAAASLPAQAGKQ